MQQARNQIDSRKRTKGSMLLRKQRERCHRERTPSEYNPDSVSSSPRPLPFTSRADHAPASRFTVLPSNSTNPAQFLPYSQTVTLFLNNPLSHSLQSLWLESKLSFQLSPLTSSTLSHLDTYLLLQHPQATMRQN
jgi:hypothetical protein